MTRDREELTRHQLDRLNQPGALDRLRSDNAFYRPRLEGLPAPLDRLESFHGLPFTRKAELVEDQRTHPPYGTNLTEPPDAYTRIHATSGTTGAKLKCLDTPESWAWFTHCWQEIYRAIGVDATDRVFAAFGFGPFVGFWAGFEAAQQVGALAIPAGAQTSSQRLDWLLESEATVLLSTPTYALRLIEVAREQGIDLRQSAVRTTLHAGEPGASIPSIRTRIETAWNARCWDHAGMSEVGPWGYECPAGGGLHAIETEFLCEVVEPGGSDPVDDGDLGELVLTNLGRWAQPVLRYRTGDIVRIDRSPCGCGAGFVRFPGGVLGRADDMIQVRGVNVYPSAVESIVREEPGIQEFQVDVEKEREMWSLRLSIEVEDAAEAEATRSRLTETLRNRLGVGADVALAPAGSLPRYELKARRFRIHRAD